MSELPEPAAPRTSLGGQAVVEGVMIRGPKGMAVCVRTPEGGIVCRNERISTSGRLRRIPIVRGIATLGETLSQGMRAFIWSAQVSAGKEPEEPTTAQVRATSALSLVFVSTLFLVGPSIATRRLERGGIRPRIAAAMEGFTRIGTLIGYLRTVGRLPQAQRLFGYHAAEHRAIQAYEAGRPLEAESLDEFPNAHVRCGTSFLLTTTVISSIVYAIVGPQPLGRRLLSRIVLMPLIAGLSYEAIRVGSTTKNPLVQAAFRPNMRLQDLTTRDPDRGQMEVALAAVHSVLELHGPAPA